MQLQQEKQSCKIKFASQMWAARPHLGSIFEKLLHRKTFYFACGSFFATNTDDFIHLITNTERKILHENMEWI